MSISFVVPEPMCGFQRGGRALVTYLFSSLLSMWLPLITTITMSYIAEIYTCTGSDELSIWMT